MDIKTMRIEETGLSTRSVNTLHRAGIFTMEELMQCSEYDLSRMRNVGRKSIEEILWIIRKYSAEAESDDWLNEDIAQEKTIEYLQKEGIQIDVLDDLSARAYNLLQFAGYSHLYQIIFLSLDDIKAIPHMDNDSALEIFDACREYYRMNRDTILASFLAEGKGKDRQISIWDMIKIPQYRDQIRQFVKINDLRLAALDLSVRPLNCLERSEYRYLSEIIFLEREDFLRMKNMGMRSCNEIIDKINAYLQHHQDRIVAYINGNTLEVLDDQTIRQRILALYLDLGFKGLHFPEIVEKIELPENYNTDAVKKIIGGLIAEGELEYVDYMVFRKYPSICSYIIENCDIVSDRGMRCAIARLRGETMEAIGQREGLSRERVRQIIDKANRKIRKSLTARNKNNRFDEDYYGYLFTNYAVERRSCVEWFGIPVETYNYLDLFNIKGKKDLVEALDDPELDIGLKLRIKNYLNRNKIFVDGNWIDKNRASLEDYVMMKYCFEETSPDAFLEFYNGFLADQGIPYSEELYFTADKLRSRINRLTESRFALWTRNQKFRYYDIDAQDYTELLDTLDLEGYENTIRSTKLFVEAFPDLMARYDIRNQYELHNLLRKIVPEGSFHAFHCGRTPIICFGQFNRAEAMLDLLIKNAPISQADLVDLVYQEYGYDKATIAATVLQDLKKYCHMGMYTIDSKVMPYLHQKKLKEALTEDFYYFDEVKEIYSRLVPDADMETINPYNLKALGFTVFSNHILQNWPSLDAFFCHLLMDEDIVNLASLKKRFGQVRMFYDTFTSLRNDYSILEFEPEQIISIKKLEKAGVTKQNLLEFCEKVYAYVDDGEYFTALSLRQSGFNSDLYDLGFSDWFYANLLRADPAFSYCRVFSNIVLCKGTEVISGKSLLVNIIKRVGKIDVYDLIHDLESDYGLTVPYKSDILGKIRGTEIYYDPILDRLYANAELYYEELERDTEDM